MCLVGVEADDMGEYNASINQCFHFISEPKRSEAKERGEWREEELGDWSMSWLSAGWHGGCDVLSLWHWGCRVHHLRTAQWVSQTEPKMVRQCLDSRYALVNLPWKDACVSRRDWSNQCSWSLSDRRLCWAMCWVLRVCWTCQSLCWPLAVVH